MMNLHTLKKIHIAVTLIVAQIVNTLTTRLSKATALDRDRPRDAFQDFSASLGTALGGNYWFWTALGVQLIVPFGLFLGFSGWSS